MKRHFCAVWRQAEKSKILVGRIRVKYAVQFESMNIALTQHEKCN